MPVGRNTDRRTPPTEDDKKRIDQKGSTLGNIARDHGRPKLGRIMDEAAKKYGDQRDEQVARGDEHHNRKKKLGK